MIAMRNIALACLCGAAGAAVGAGWPQPAAAADLPGWTIEVREFQNERPATSVATDGAGNVYVGGGGSGDEAVLVKYGADLNRLWTRRSEAGQINGIATDKEGDIFISGSVSSGRALAKLGPDGTLLWTRRSKSNDGPSSVATDAHGNVFAAGYTGGRLFGPNAGSFDGWLAKYGGDGTLQWGTQFGGADNDFVFGTATDRDGNVFVAGGTGSSLFAPILGGGDAFVAKYHSDGVLLWGSQFGRDEEAWTDRGHEGIRGVASDADGNVFVTGYTTSKLFSDNANNGHDTDAFVAKLNGNDGTLLWGVQFGSSDYNDEGQGVAVAPDGTVYVTGWTDGEVFRPRIGFSDVWVARFDQDGRMIQGGQFGRGQYSYANAIAAAADGTAFVAGDNSYGGFLAKLTAVAAP